MQLQNEETRSCERFKLSAKLWLSTLTSRTGHQAAWSSPRWQPPDLEFLANLEENFIGLESSSKVGSSVSNLPLYNLSVGKNKNPAILEWTSPLDIFSKFNPLNRDRVDAEIAHFYANKMHKMNHQNFNEPQDARYWLEELTPFTLNLEQILLFEWHVKKISNKANSHRGCHIGFNYPKGTGDD